jgi:hypothetical protein
MLGDRFGPAVDPVRRRNDAFDTQVADVFRLLESLRNDWPEMLRLVDEVVACEVAIEHAASTARPDRVRLAAQTQLDRLNAGLWELTHRADSERTCMWPTPSTH